MNGILSGTDSLPCVIPSVIVELGLIFRNDDIRPMYDINIFQACIQLSFSPPGGGGKSKGLEMGREIKKEKKRKRKFGEKITFDSTKS